MYKLSFTVKILNKKQRGRKMKKRATSIIKFIICTLLIALSSFIGIKGLTVAGYRAQSFGEVINRGLDLQGGVSILLEVVPEKNKKIDSTTLERTKELLNLRVNKLGVSETSVAIEGTNRIRIDMPGKTDAKSLNDSLTQTGKLTFVGPDNVVILTGEDVKSAKAYLDQNAKATIGLELNAAGTKKFADATAKFIGQNIAIKMDEDTISNPVVNEAIPNGNAVISGSSSLEEAKKTAGIIEAGALPVALKNVETKTVGPTLGETSIPLSLTAGAVGIALVLLFMIIYYRVPGILADLALVLYIILVLLAFKVVGVVLTLPGIAGFLLTIGMAVDANVLIFERIKEELRTGRSSRSAIEAGFHRALSSIMDSNITTIIAGVVLYYLGSGSVKGFALTLIIGIVLSMFSAIIVTKFFMKLGLDMGILSKPKYFGVRRG